MWQDARALNATANGLMALVVLACFASGVWWVSQRPMFTLKSVRVESMYDIELKRVNELTLRAGVIGKFRGNFFTTNLEQVRTAFESALGAARDGTARVARPADRVGRGA